MNDDEEEMQLEEHLRVGLNTRQPMVDLERQVQAVVTKGRYHLGIRDLTTFGFSHMLTVLIALFSQLYKSQTTGQSR